LFPLTVTEVDYVNITFAVIQSARFVPPTSLP
jgi:hypothetical protein